jgi:hypothetical protein
VIRLTQPYPRHSLQSITNSCRALAILVIVTTSGPGIWLRTPGGIRLAERGRSPGPLALSPLLTSPVRFIELKLKGLLDRKGLWRSLREMRRMFNFHRTPASGEELGLGFLTSALGCQFQGLSGV